MIWPPQSPDLSPIELLWEEVYRQVQAKRPTSLEKLVAIIKETWNEISENVLEKLLHRMPLLCQAVIDAEGTLMKNLLHRKNNLFIIEMRMLVCSSFF